MPVEGTPPGAHDAEGHLGAVFVVEADDQVGHLVERLSGADVFTADVEADFELLDNAPVHADALGIVEATTAVRPKDLEGSLSLLGEEGTVVIGGFAVNQIMTWNFNNPLPGDEDVFTTGGQDPPNVYGFGHIPYLENVVDSIINGTPALVDGLEGRRSLELISAIYESIETGNEIPLRFQPKRCRLGIKSA